MSLIPQFVVSVIATFYSAQCLIEKTKQNRSVETTGPPYTEQYDKSTCCWTRSSDFQTPAVPFQSGTIFTSRWTDRGKCSDTNVGHTDGRSLMLFADCSLRLFFVSAGASSPVTSHTARTEARKSNLMRRVSVSTFSEDSQVVAALGSHFHRHALVITCDQAVQEAPGLLGKALFPFVDGALLLARVCSITTKADLSNHAFKEFGHIMLQRRRGLYELAVKHHCTRSALWEKKQTMEWNGKLYFHIIVITHDCLLHVNMNVTF